MSDKNLNNPYDEHPENLPNPGNESFGADAPQEPAATNPYADGNLNPYPNTSHPEDQPGFGHSTAAYQTPYTAPIQTGSVDYTTAVKEGFKATARNWHVWVLGTLVIFGTFFAFSFTNGLKNAERISQAGSTDMELLSSSLPSIAETIIMVAIVLATPFIIHAANLSAVQEKITWSEVFRVHSWGRPLAASLLWSVVSSVVALLVMVPALTSNNIAAFFGLFALYGVISLLVSPLVQFWQYYAAYPDTTLIQSLKDSIAAGKKIYGGLLLFNILFGVALVMVTMFTLGLAIIFIMPASYVVYAHVARQIYPFVVAER